MKSVDIIKKFKGPRDEFTNPNTLGPGFIGTTVILLISLFALFAFIKWWNE